MDDSSSLSSFLGVWQRTELYEPRGQLGSEFERKKIVIWVQSSCGLFVDIRVCPDMADNENVLNLKSFAGRGGFDSSLNHFTWTRLMDFRPPGAPDVGLMNFTSPLVIEEDGVLPGDDFKEIWTQLSPRLGEDDMYYDFACEVESNEGERKGYFLVVGDFFAFTLTRSNDFTLEQLNSIFDGETATSQEDNEKVLKHLCCMGKTSDWKVLYSLDLRFVDNTILSGGNAASEIDGILQSLRFSVVHGTPPDRLSSLLDRS